MTNLFWKKHHKKLLTMKYINCTNSTYLPLSHFLIFHILHMLPDTFNFFIHSDDHKIAIHSLHCESELFQHFTVLNRCIHYSGNQVTLRTLLKFIGSYALVQKKMNQFSSQQCFSGL